MSGKKKRPTPGTVRARVERTLANMKAFWVRNQLVTRRRKQK